MEYVNSSSLGTPSPALLDMMVSRRSAAALAPPGPTRDELERILAAAGAVPDHGLLRPFRFVIAEGEGRARFGDALAKTAAEHRPDLPAVGLEKVRAKAFRSPTVVVLVASRKSGKIEAWEQNATAACAGYAIILAAHALGIGAVWKSVPFTTGRALSDTLGLTDGEEMLGWIHLGKAARDEEVKARQPLVVGEVATILDMDGRKPFA
jgi:nitroreductase